MISVSPQTLIVPHNQKDIVLSINTESRKYTIELIAIKTTSKTLHIEVCQTPAFTHIQNAESTDKLQISSDSINTAVENCQKNGAQFAFRITPKEEQSSKLHSLEQIIIPIIQVGKNNPLAQTNRSAVLGELSRTIIMNDLICTPKIVTTEKLVHCISSITNDTDSPIYISAVAALRGDFFISQTTDTQPIFSQVLLSQNQSIPIEFSISTNNMPIIRNIIEARVSFSAIDSTAPAYIVSKESTHYFFPVELLIAICVAGIVISAILIKKIIAKFKERNSVRSQKND